MPGQSTHVIPPHQGDKKPSEEIIKLGKKITDVAAHMLGKVTSDDPEYWGLAEIITEEEAKIANTMEKRKHYTFDQLCEMNKKKIEEVGKDGFQKILDHMGSTELAANLFRATQNSTRSSSRSVTFSFVQRYPR